MKKIIIILFLCVSCGKSQMKAESLSSSSSLVDSSPVGLCKQKCEDIYKVAVSAANSYPGTSYDYKQSLIYDLEIIKQSCVDHCSFCEKEKWNTSVYSIDKQPPQPCTGLGTPTSPYICPEHPEVKNYCKESDWK